MAIAIASVPVLKGAASDRFEQQMKESESRRGSVDFTKSIETARKILAKAKTLSQQKWATIVLWANIGSGRII